MIQRLEARRLSSSKEWGLISSTLPPALGKLSVVRLKAKIVRAGKLRQKYRDLYRREAIVSKSRITGPHTRPNVRTRRKEQMFDEAIVRLKLQLDKTSVPLKRSTQTKTRATSMTLARSARKRTVLHKRRHSHVAASTRRRQAKRALARQVSM
jgi:hypothetical protein